MAGSSGSSAADTVQRQLLLPVDADGVCMSCKQSPHPERAICCTMCGSTWHLDCLESRPETVGEVLSFVCPDCSGEGLTGARAPSDDGELRVKIKAIDEDGSLSDGEKARRRQELVGGKISKGGEEQGKKGKGKMNEALAVLSESFRCSFCMQLPERPVTTPCGHNFCLKCFQKWIGQGNRTCAKCRSNIPPQMANQPRINSSLVVNIRRARMLRTCGTEQPQKVHHSLKDEDLPDEPYVTERAKKGGIANAKSGRIFVTVTSDHFGSISAESDPVMNLGILVGQCFANRYKCRQWGVHRPLVCGISGQSNVGAQSVVLSGGYVDDEDHGEWFLYTGSGGRDLSGNKRTNKDQSFDQEFKNFNEALRVSCKKGYPVRVVRSHKEKRSSYAPVSNLRYDGIYRIEKCWIKVGMQGFKVCRYLFVRCDNEPAPWTSDENGDHPRPLPVVPELQQAIDIFERTESPSWDYDGEKACWLWKKPPPSSKEKVTQVNPEFIKRARKGLRRAQNASLRVELLNGFSCLLCKNVLNLPVTTPCAHNFCKSCLQDTFSGQAFIRERKCQSGRQLRSQKNIMKCPVCPSDISEFLQNIQVNSELMTAIEKLQTKIVEDEKELEESSDDGAETEVSKGEKEPEESGDGGAETEVNSSEIGQSKAEAEGINGTLKRKAPDGCCFKSDNGDESTEWAADIPPIDSNVSPSSPLHLDQGDESS